MKISDYDYHLPEERIAVHPPDVRGSSRLLVLRRDDGHMQDKYYRDLPDFLEAGDVLVLNDTKVIKARLLARTADGSQRELLLLEKHGETTDVHLQKVMYRRRLKAGMKLYVGEAEIFVKEVLGDGLAVIHSAYDLLQLADDAGNVPLPPYMHREADDNDIVRYQTIFAKEAGSVAAPTASLNLTDEILERIRTNGVQIVYLTLHVGLGTFMPIRSDAVEDHEMHQEYFHIPIETIQAIRSAKRVVAVGTTVTRTLEYAADSIAASKNDLSGEADIFMYPGYQFKIVDALLTNFHAPRSTVLMLAAAFAGWGNLKAAYEHALNEDYSLLSYGDSMLII